MLLPTKDRTGTHFFSNASLRHPLLALGIPFAQSHLMVANLYQLMVSQRIIPPGIFGHSCNCWIPVSTSNFQEEFSLSASLECLSPSPRSAASAWVFNPQCSQYFQYLKGSPMHRYYLRPVRFCGTYTLPPYFAGQPHPMYLLLRRRAVGFRLCDMMDG
jgi:hypothetical protein